MIGLAEVLVVGVIVALIVLSRRRGGPPSRSRETRARATRSGARVPRHLVTLVGAVGAAVVVALVAVWAKLPPSVGTVAAGLVAGIAAAMLANR